MHRLCIFCMNEEGIGVRSLIVNISIPGVGLVSQMGQNLANIGITVEKAYLKSSCSECSLMISFYHQHI
jgi:hypothetical protein